MAEKFAVRLCRLRDQAELTNAELARQSGLTPSTVSELATGDKEPTLGTLIALSAVLKASLGDWDGIRAEPPVKRRKRKNPKKS